GRPLSSVNYVRLSQPATCSGDHCRCSKVERSPWTKRLRMRGHSSCNTIHHSVRAGDDADQHIAQRQPSAGARETTSSTPARSTMASTRLRPPISANGWRLVRKTQPYSKRIAHKGIWVEPKLLAE